KPMKRPTDVALLLWNPDVIQLMTWLLLDRDLGSCGVEPSEDPEVIEDLIASRHPAVIVFDLIPPYEISASILRRLADRFPELSVVVTCADSSLALKKALWLSAHPLFQKPYDAEAVANVVSSLVVSARQGYGALTMGA